MLKHLSVSENRRVRVTVSCRDTDLIPKVAKAGDVIDQNGERVQIMHEGTRVIADAYCGEWMTEVIGDLRGHHEPQEELLFHHLLAHVRSGSMFVELGCWWAYYTNWYLGAVPGSAAICVEPDPANLEVGRRNLAMNGRSATFIQAFVGDQPAPQDAVTAVHGAGKPACLDMNALLTRAGGVAIEMLHMDVQGAELCFLQSMRRAVEAGKVRFVVVSTHHESISGSSTTHEDCVAAIERLGATVLVEHDVFESFSGDGLIVASFAAEDRSIVLPAISRNIREMSLFPNLPRLAAPVVAQSSDTILSLPEWLQRPVSKISRSVQKRLGFAIARRAA